jgi:hypothetical protein
MTTKITPQIFNGNWQLIISETLSCIPSQGLQMHVPVSPGKSAIFTFVFNSTTNPSDRDVNIDQFGENLTFTFTNFSTSLGASLLDPFRFHVGDDNFFLQLYGISTGQDILCLTISIFKEKYA